MQAIFSTMNKHSGYISHLLVFSIIILFSTLSVKAQSKEYILKAGFLEKFARFSEWPDEKQIDTFNITVIGNSPFNGILEELYSSHTIKDKPVHINYISSISQINNCQILFIAVENTRILESILEETKDKPILTISEKDGFGKKGVLLNFFITEQGTVHFEINYQKVKQSGISMDIFLLEYAKIIE